MGVKRKKMKTAYTHGDLRNALRNGTSLLFDTQLDQRYSFAKRYRRLLQEHSESLGGVDNLGAGELALLQRAIMLIMQLEKYEIEFAATEAMVSPAKLEVYQKWSTPRVACWRA